MSLTLLRILIVEDREDDALLIETALEDAGYEIRSRHVASAPALREALEASTWDLITSDHAMPHFSSRGALKTLKTSGLDIPFIIVSGSIGEMEAVEMMRLGAHDYVTKNSLHRLAPVVERELREARNRREKREALERLASSEREFRSIFELGAAGLAQVDVRSGRFIRVNARLCELAGRSHRELLRMSLRSLIPNTDLRLLIETYRRFRNGTERAFDQEIRYRCGTEIRWALVSAAMMRGEKVDGDDRATIVVLDVSPMKALERSLRETVEARDRFLSIASHELKTPLASMKLQIQIARRQLRRDAEAWLKSETVSTFLEAEDRQITSLSRLVDDMLDVARIRSGRIPLRKRACDLTEIIHNAITSVRNALESSGSQLSVEVDDHVNGFWDSQRIEQVLVNLLSNAARYGEGHPIRLVATAVRDQARIRVEDEGQGIPAEDHARVFDQFERGVSESEISGLGLGLYIVRQIVQLHGGRIDLESEPGRGAAFTVWLPRHLDTAAKATPPHEGSREPIA